MKLSKERSPTNFFSRLFSFFGSFNLDLARTNPKGKYLFSSKDGGVFEGGKFSDLGWSIVVHPERSIVLQRATLVGCELMVSWRRADGYLGCALGAPCAVYGYNSPTCAGGPPHSSTWVPDQPPLLGPPGLHGYPRRAMGETLL